MWRRKCWGCSRLGEVLKPGWRGVRTEGVVGQESSLRTGPGDWSHETCFSDGKVTSQGLQLCLKTSNYMGPRCQTALNCPTALLPCCCSCTALLSYPSCQPCLPCLPCSRSTSVLPWMLSEVLQLHQPCSLSIGPCWLWGRGSSLLSSFHSNKSKEWEGR